MTGLIARLEGYAARLQGKGYGSTTIHREVSAARRLLKSDPGTVIDVGGNIGLYSEEVLRRFPQARIHVFEPSAENAEILRKRFIANGNVAVQQKALGREPGARSLYADVSGSGFGSLTRRRLDHFNLQFNWHETVEVIRFEEYWRKELEGGEIGLVKLDVEGHELDVLMGFGEAIEHVDVLQFEFGGCNIDTRTFFQDFWYFFKPLRFDLYRIAPFALQRITAYSEKDEYFSTTNFLAKSRR